MTELEMWKLAAQPAIFALAMLTLLRASWRVRLLAAACGAVIGLTIGVIAMWAERSGASWLGWILAAICLVLVWRQGERRGFRGVFRAWAQPPKSKDDVS
ncbi:hypothetical protein D3C86_273640 [compost metagenome]